MIKLNNNNNNDNNNKLCDVLMESSWRAHLGGQPAGGNG